MKRSLLGVMFVFLVMASVAGAAPLTNFNKTNHLQDDQGHDVVPMICLDAQNNTVTCLASAVPVSNTAQTWTTSSDRALNITTAAGVNRPCLVILGHDGSCTDLLWTLTNSSSAPNSYFYVSASAMPYPIPGLWSGGTILHVKAVSANCLGQVNISLVQ